MADRSHLTPESLRVRLGAHGVAVPISRRALLRRASAFGVVAASAGLLAACGGSSKATATKPAAQTPTVSSASSPSATSGASASTPTAGASGGGATPTASASSGGAVPETPVSALASDQTVRLPGGEPTPLDPGVSEGDYELLMLMDMFDGLVGVDVRNGQVVPRVAEKYETNADGSVYTFHVRSGVTWSDGTPLTAKDFEYSWKRVLDPNTKSLYVSALFPIKGAQEYSQGSGSLDAVGIAAPDDATVVVTLVGPTPYFPLLASTWTFFPVPKHVIDKAGDKWTEEGNIVSNGPYMLTKWSHDQEIDIELNPKYYGDAPTITKVTYPLYQDPISQALVAYENNELDSAFVSGPDVGRVQGDSTLSKELGTYPQSSTRFIICDATNAPTSDVKVRQALSMAINRDTLATQILKGQFAPADTMLPPSMPGYNPDAALGEDVDKAKQLLVDANFPGGKGLSLTITYQNTADDSNIAEFLQGTWNQNLGVNVQLAPLDPQAFQDWRGTRQQQPFNVYIANWGSDWNDPANWHNQLFLSGVGFYSDSHWKNDDFDRIVTAARVMTDATQRIAQYQQAEKILVQDAAYIPLLHSNGLWVTKPYLKDAFHPPILGFVTYVRYLKVEQH